MLMQLAPAPLLAFGKGDAGMTITLIAVAVLALIGLSHAIRARARR